MEPESVTTKRTLAERAREAWEAAQRRVSEMRLARARGGDGSPSASEVQKAKADAELAEDKAALAAKDAAEAEARAAEDARRAAIRAERARVLAIHDAVEREALAVHVAAEALGAAVASYMATVNGLCATEPKLTSAFADGALHKAWLATGAAWPLHVPLNVQRPTPYRDAARRALFPQELRVLLAEKLPAPSDHDAMSSEVRAA